MDPALIDPLTHAPVVTPDDVWGDPKVLSPVASGAPLVLPPKKTRGEPSSSRKQTGLRIGAETPQRPAEDPDNQIEVRQIDGHVVRLAPEIPETPKVPRLISYQERPASGEASRASRGEGKEWGHGRTQSIRWLLGAGLGVACVVVVALLLLPLINKSNAAHPRPGQMGLVVEKEEKVEHIEQMNDLLSRQPEAEQLFRAFASTSIMEEILPLVRDASAVEPLIRANRRPALVTKAWFPPKTTLWSMVENDGHPFALLEGTFPDFSKFSAYCVLEHHQLHLDWKATNGYGTATFGQLALNQGDPGEIRGKIISSRFYTAIYPEAEFQSYQLVSPDESQAIWCYTRRGEEADTALGRLFWSGEILETSMEQKKVTVRLAHGSEGSLPNQWMIAQLLHNDWVNP